ncbi:MAG: CsbD family protein [Nitrococcus mobilis]|nr:CsbD family protein [Nitrococcus mobilis]
MFRDQIGGSWHILKGKVRQQWGVLTNQDLDHLTEGYEEELTGKIQKAYGISKKEADEKLREWYRQRNAPQDTDSSPNPPASPLS